MGKLISDIDGHKGDVGVDPKCLDEIQKAIDQFLGAAVTSVFRVTDHNGPNWHIVPYPPDWHIKPL